MERAISLKMKTITPSVSGILLRVVLMISIFGLGADLYLRLSSESSLCPTEACAIVGDYIRIGEFNLVLLGLGFFIGFWTVYFLASRYKNEWLWTSVLILLLGALAFDGALLGFQYFAVNEQCLLCAGVGAALFLVLLLFSFLRRQAAVFALGLSVWAGGGLAGALIDIPERPPRLDELAGITILNSETEKWPQYSYFFSFHCPHCTTVLAMVSRNENIAHRWRLFPLDNTPEDLRKIAWALKRQAEGRNVFDEIVRVAKDNDVPDVHVPEDLADRIGRARSYFEGSGFRSVPLLIADESRGKRVILVGAGNITDYLHRQGAIGKESRTDIEPRIRSLLDGAFSWSFSS